MIYAIYDMETQDPDDLFALAILATHPQSTLLAVTLTPGSRAQVGLIRNVLNRLNVDVPIGSFNPDHEKDCISPFWTKLLGPTTSCAPDGLGYQVITTALMNYPDATVITGAPLKNLGAFLEHNPSRQIIHWVGQGGFAGDSVVPAEYRLEKFVGRETCPTFNFNGDPKSALAMLNSPMVFRRHLVSKNVCHGVIYDQVMHAKVKAAGSRVVKFIESGMEYYLATHNHGKAFHDPLACCIAIDPSIAEFREVEIYRSKGEWGSRLCPSTRTFITVKADIEKFTQVMIGSAATIV